MTFESWWAVSRHIMPNIVKIDAREAWIAATKTEREACAKVCEDLAMFLYDDPGESYSKAIRERTGLNE